MYIFNGLYLNKIKFFAIYLVSLQFLLRNVILGLSFLTFDCFFSLKWVGAGVDLVAFVCDWALVGAGVDWIVYILFLAGSAVLSQLFIGVNYADVSADLVITFFLYIFNSEIPRKKKIIVSRNLFQAFLCILKENWIYFSALARAINLKLIFFLFVLILWLDVAFVEGVACYVTKSFGLDLSWFQTFFKFVIFFIILFLFLFDIFAVVSRDYSTYGKSYNSNIFFVTLAYSLGLFFSGVYGQYLGHYYWVAGRYQVFGFNDFFSHTLTEAICWWPCVFFSLLWILWGKKRGGLLALGGLIILRILFLALFSVYIMPFIDFFRISSLIFLGKSASVAAFIKGKAFVYFSINSLVSELRWGVLVSWTWVLVLLFLLLVLPFFRLFLKNFWVSPAELVFFITMVLFFPLVVISRRFDLLIFYINVIFCYSFYAPCRYIYFSGYAKSFSGTSGFFFCRIWHIFSLEIFFSSLFSILSLVQLFLFLKINENSFCLNNFATNIKKKLEVCSQLHGSNFCEAWVVLLKESHAFYLIFCFLFLVQISLAFYSCPFIFLGPELKKITRKDYFSSLYSFSVFVFSILPYTYYLVFFRPALSFSITILEYNYLKVMSVNFVIFLITAVPVMYWADRSTSDESLFSVSFFDNIFNILMFSRGCAFSLGLSVEPFWAQYGLLGLNIMVFFIWYFFLSYCKSLFTSFCSVNYSETGYIILQEYPLSFVEAAAYSGSYTWVTTSGVGVSIPNLSYGKKTSKLSKLFNFFYFIDFAFINLGFFFIIVTYTAYISSFNRHYDLIWSWDLFKLIHDAYAVGVLFGFWAVFKLLRRWLIFDDSSNLNFFDVDSGGYPSKTILVDSSFFLALFFRYFLFVIFSLLLFCFVISASVLMFIDLSNAPFFCGDMNFLEWYSILMEKFFS